MCKNRLAHILPRFVCFAPLVLPLLLGCAGASPPQVAELSRATVEKAEGKLILYEALSQNGARVYVLGSIHMADKGLYPMDPTIEQAYTSSDALVVEADVTKVDPLEVMKLVVRYASLPQGSALQQTISSDAYGQLEKFLAQRGVPMSNVDGFEPWWVAMNVGILRFKEQGLSSDDGIDKHFLDRSHAAGKTVLELESVQAQLAMLDSLPANVQEMMLLDALEGGLQSGGDIQRVLAAWKEGNAEEIEKVAFAELNGTPAWAPLKEALFTKRNLGMANKIDTMAAPGKSLFVVIGAGHVVGSQGVPALLAGKGYAIRQLDKGPEPRVERP